VPELTNKNAITVLERLSDLGLNTKVKGSEYSSSIPMHYVIYQDPEPGTIIKKGREVKIVLSKGPQTFLTPNLVNVPYRQAEALLANNGLKSGVVSRAFSQSVKKDFVIAHTPAAGAEITRSDRVDLLISLGPRPKEFLMPDIKGIGLEEAVRIIEECGLTVGKIHSVYREAEATNIIIDQDPLSGYYVQSDQRVDLAVNRWQGEGEAAKGFETEPNVLFRYQVPPGILKQHIRLELNAFGISSTIYDELMPPGRKIWLMVPKYSDAVVFLYKNDKLIETEIY
jgi:serine/threonine-protein kinase